MFKFVRTMLAMASVIAIGSPAFAVQPVSDMQITVSPSSIAPGDSAVVTGTVLPNDGLINCGEGKFSTTSSTPI